jgi:hypothetical protein
MKYIIGILLFIAIPRSAYPQQTNQLYLFAGDTVQRVVVDFSPPHSNLVGLVDSLSKALPDGQWCLTSKVDSMRCRCRFNTVARRIEGRFTEFDAAGRGQAVSYYLSDKVNGIVVNWSGVGGLQSLATMENDKLNGTRVSFNYRGRVQSVSYWYQGALISSKRYLLPRRNKLLERLFNVEEMAGKNILKPLQ